MSPRETRTQRIKRAREKEAENAIESANRKEAFRYAREARRLVTTATITPTTNTADGAPEEPDAVAAGTPDTMQDAPRETRSVKIRRRRAGAVAKAAELARQTETRAQRGAVPSAAPA